MKPGLCLATFRDRFGIEGDGLTHRCAHQSGHPGNHHCICVSVVPPLPYGPRYFDRQGKPLPMCGWAVLFEDREEYGRIAQTTVGGWWISTVWLGMDHRWGPGPPLIFESMVFWHGPVGSEADRGDEEQYRYSTEAEARRGHTWLVREYRRKVKALARLDRLTGDVLGSSGNT